MKFPERVLEVEGIEDPALADTFARFSRLPHFRIARGQAMKALKALNPKGILLDVGCGPGWFLRDIHRKFPKLRLTGCDLSERMVVHASRNLEGIADVMIGDAQNLLFASNTFDYVTSTLAFHHFPEPAKALCEFHRVLKPGGVMVVSDAMRDAGRLFLKIIGFITKFVAPKALRKANEPQSSIMASFTIDEYRNLMKESLFSGWEVREGSFLATVVGVK